MKFRRDKNILRLSGIAILLIIASGIMLGFPPDYSYFGIGFALLLMGIIAIVAVITAAITPEEYLIQDERSARVDEKAGYHAFCILLLTMALLQAIGMIWRLNFNFKAVIPDLFIVGIWSWIILRWHYNRRGDAR
jgi:uncharacterized membrane protein